MTDITDELIATQRAASAPPTNRPGRIATKTVWFVALLVIGGLAVTGEIDLSTAQSAPQQAAAASMACFRIIGIYTFARAMDALWR